MEGAADKPITEYDPLLTPESRSVRSYSRSLCNEYNSNCQHPEAQGGGGGATPDDSGDTEAAKDGVILPRRKWIIEPSAVLFCLAIFSQLPVLNQYLYYRVGLQYNATVNSSRAYVCNKSSLANSTEHRTTSRIQNEATEWTLYRNVASSVTALLLLPVYASSSDYLGRKPALLLPSLGIALDCVGLLLVVLLDLPLVWLIVSAGIGALGGGFGAMFAGMFVYLADTTSRQERPVRIAIVEGTFGLAGGLMEVAMGWWVRLMGYSAPILFSAAVATANVLYVAFLVPEVRPPKKKRQQYRSSTLTAAVVVSAAAAPFVNIVGLFRTGSRQLTVTLTLLLAAVGIYCASFIGGATLSALYQMNYPFCMDSVLIGYVNAIKIVGFQIGVAIGLAVLRRYCGVRPLGLVIVGLVSAAIGSLATGLARSTPMLLGASGLALFSMVPIPMIRAHTSHVAPVDKQGALFSCIGIMEVLGSLVGSSAFTSLYKATQAWLSGFVYLAVACNTLLALALTVACAAIGCCCRAEKNPTPRQPATISDSCDSTTDSS